MSLSVPVLADVVIVVCNTALLGSASFWITSLAPCVSFVTDFELIALPVSTFIVVSVEMVVGITKGILATLSLELLVVVSFGGLLLDVEYFFGRRCFFMKSKICLIR